MKVQTDTATIIFYDPACLKHRLFDVCDWWSNPKLELEEINSGNVAFIGTGSDGVFDVEISSAKAEKDHLYFKIKNESGMFFLGGGESITGDQFEPDKEDGVFLKYPSGTYEIYIWENNGKLIFNISATNEVASNQFISSPKLY